MRSRSLSVSLFCLLVPQQLPAVELQHGQVHLEQCMSSALSRQFGRVVKVELKTESDALVYEFDIRDGKGMDWDIECDAGTGEIIEIESEVTSFVPVGSDKKVGISEKAARGIALQHFPGEIVELEYEVESDGTLVYEFDIVLKNAKRMKVEINAEDGSIHEANEELWQIGYE